MQIRVAHAVRVLAVVVAGGLAGCAGSAQRLPQCSGRPVPINPVTATAVVADPGHGQVEIAREGGRTDAH